MKLLLASHSAADTEGAGLALYELARGLKGEDGLRLHVVLPSAGPLLDRLQALGLETSVEPYLWGWVCGPASLRGRARLLAGHALGVVRLIRLLRRARPDAVVTNTLVIPGAALAAGALRIPHVWYVHEFGVKDHGFTFDVGFERSLRVVSRLSRLVIANSRPVLEELARHVGRDKLRLVSYAVDVPGQPEGGEPAQDGWKAVLVGRKAPGKGQDDAIEAAALLRRAGRRIRLRLVGGGDPAYVSTLEVLARRLGVDDCVEFLPATRDVFPHFEWSSVALVCSRAEAFGRVTIEAMKVGRPVIGARSAATAELIRDGWNGLLYEPGDAADLASKLAFLLGNPETAARLAGTAQAWSLEEFTMERFVEGFMQVIQEALGGRR